MRQLTLLLITVALMSACASAPVRIDSQALANSPPEASDRFIVAAIDNRPDAILVRAGSTARGYDAITAYGPTPGARQVMRALEADYKLQEVNAWPIEPLHMHCAVLKIPEGTDRDALLVRLSHDKRILIAQPLQTFATRTDPYNDPYVGLQRGFQQMDVADAQTLSRGEGVKVAIIDTGVDTAHPDLARSIAVAKNLVDADDRQFRSDRHGTEIAGVIAAVANNHEGIVGIAPEARLMVFKACWQVRADADAALCNSFTLARALVAALDAHAQVINMSLAGPEDPLLSGLIREGVHRGILFVGAASAQAADGKPSLLHQAGVIEVASTESASAPAFALHAPGREILTSLPGGHYDFASGDSIATANVTGVVALLLEKNRALSATAAYQVLRDTSSSSGDASDPQVDACAAVAALISRGACAPNTSRRLADGQDSSDLPHRP
jgi:subtilisin family serine protease